MAFDLSPGPENPTLLDACRSRPLVDGGLRIPRIKGVEIPSLTSIRGFAATWVVLLHSSVLLFSVLPEASALRSLIEAGGFAVPLFFILSGYVLGFSYATRLGSLTTGKVLRFWLLRLGRVYPVHLLTLLASLAMAARRGWPADGDHGVERFVSNLLLIQAWDYSFRLSWNYPSWSISSEWFAYLLFPFLAAALSRLGRPPAVVLLVAACGLSALVYSARRHLAFEGLAVVLPTFIGGVALAIVCPPGCSTSRSRPWAEIVSLAIVALPFIVGPGPVQGALFLFLFFALVAALGSWGNRSGVFWRGRWVVYLGEISYSLYMTHAISLTLLSRFFPFDSFHGFRLPVRLLILLGCTAAILAVSAMVYHAIEWPCRGVFRRLAAYPKVVD